MKSRKKRTLAPLFGCFLLSCMELPERPEALTPPPLQVLYIVPSSGETISRHPTFAVFFSQPVDAPMVDDRSVLLLPDPFDPQQFSTASRLNKAIENEDILSLDLGLSLEGEGRVLFVTPQDSLGPGQSYSLLITTRLLSEEKMPLNQNPSDSAAPFVATYETVEDPPQNNVDKVLQADRNDADPIGNDVAESGPVPGPSLPTPFSSEPPPLPEQSDAGPAAAPGSAPAGPVVDQTTTDATIDPTAIDPIAIDHDVAAPVPVSPAIPAVPETSPETSTATPTPVIVINELFYDAVGSDTNGVLFIELYGTAGAAIGRYKINFANGADGKIYDSITLPEGASIGGDGFYLIADSRDGSTGESRVVGANFVTNFDPQNGPDAVQLIGPEGDLIDALGYGPGVVSPAENGLNSFEGTAAPDVSNGHSLERLAPGQDSGDNSLDFKDILVPTPGH